jgi:hypothetical protein
VLLQHFRQKWALNILWHVDPLPRVSCVNRKQNNSHCYR